MNKLEMMLLKYYGDRVKPQDIVELVDLVYEDPL